MLSPVLFTFKIFLDGNLVSQFPAILMLLSCFLFLLAFPLYAKLKASKGLFTAFAQVVVVAYKNREFSLIPVDASWCYHYVKDRYSLCQLTD